MNGVSRLERPCRVWPDHVAKCVRWRCEAHPWSSCVGMAATWDGAIKDLASHDRDEHDRALGVAK